MTLPAIRLDRQGATVAPPDGGACFHGRAPVTLSGADQSPEAGRGGDPIFTPSRSAHPIIATHLGEAP